MISSTDRVEKSIFLRAPRERVWRALIDPREFGDWFGIELDGQFVAGKQVTGRIKPTAVD
ncbi:MAG: vanillate O-demethylase oxidoreductase VanB, partial [Candidatus Eremiobacteraeota bacterium]|nr:vanillate O-demethylase oxidoreductase VanB [Candidatus Eremiobacteraeota bacterium]